jgi:glucose/mannose-6-phosphate isomerase
MVDDQGEQLREAQEVLRQGAAEFGLSVPLDRNRAKQVALRLQGKFPFIYAWGRCLEVVALRWRAQLAENSKQLSSHHLFPEMNHNEIVGWGGLKEFHGKMVVILLRDEEEPKAIGKRMEITKELIEPFAAEIVEAWSRGTSRLARLFSLISLGDFVSFYLAALNGVDPTPIRRIEELKRRLSDG